MEYKVGMYLLIKESVESWHWVKIAKIVSINGNDIEMIAIQFTGDGSCPRVFKNSLLFNEEENLIKDLWDVFNTEDELLAKLI